MTSELRLRQFGKLDYRDPYQHLIDIREIEIPIALSPTPKPLKNLRTNSLKLYREMRDAALFCVGISEIIGTKVVFAMHEDQDFDFVSAWRMGDTVHFCPVQLKEVVAEELNPNASVQGVVDQLTKYADAGDVTVVIKIGRQCRWDPRSMKLPHGLSIGGLWVFGGIREDQSEFAIWGDFIATPSIDRGAVFSYPEAQIATTTPGASE